MKKVLLFETTVTYFLGKVRYWLKKLQKVSFESNEAYDYMEKIEDLFEDFFEELPIYCGGLLRLLNRILDVDVALTERVECVESAIDVCEVLAQKPSFKTFRGLVARDYAELEEDERFSKEYLEDIIKELWKRQIKYENYLRNTENRKEWSHYQRKLIENDKLWIAVIKMTTVTEDILLKIIRYAHIGYSYFFGFCIELVYSNSATEKVWIALIEKIKKEKFYEIRRSEVQAEKTSIMCSLFELRKPPIDAIYKIIEIITPSGKHYYDFYYLIAKYYWYEKDVLQKIQERLKQEKNDKNSENIKKRGLELILRSGTL